MHKKHIGIQAILLSAAIILASLPAGIFAAEPAQQEIYSADGLDTGAFGIEMPEVGLTEEDAIQEDVSEEAESDEAAAGGASMEDALEQPALDPGEDAAEEASQSPEEAAGGKPAQDPGEDAVEEAVRNSEEAAGEQAAQNTEKDIDEASEESAEETMDEPSAAGSAQEMESLPEGAGTVTKEVEEVREETDVEQEDSDTLFEGYAERAFEEAVGSSDMGRSGSGKKSRGDRLTGQNKAIYDVLKDAALEIASGQRDSSVVEIPLTKLGIDPDHEYTAEDLGLDYIYRQINGQSEWNPKIGTAMSNLLTFDMNLIHKSLVADCPYELYWSGGAISYPSGFRYSKRALGYGNDWVGYVKLNDSVITFEMVVEEKYRQEPGDQFSVDTDKTGVVANAVAFAQSIVADADEAGKSDYERLVYYKDRICGEVVYNDDAAENNGNYPDRGPWALIYVFDQDPETNVVCEGYSEAFQYLCELTDFNSREICVYSPSGTMAGGTGTGPHKWNIVHMDDGLNYMADVTNSDEGAVGKDGRLFLKGISGSVRDGYVLSWPAGKRTVEEEGRIVTYSWPAGYVSYVYNEDMMSIFTEEELTLSAQDYDPSSAPAVPTVDEIARIKSLNMTLTERISLNVHVVLDEDYFSQDVFMTFTCAGRTVTQKVSEADMDEEDRAVFSLDLAARQMTDEVTFFMTVGGTKGTSFTSSVRSYADDILDENSSYTDSERAMARAMLSYGSYTQLYAGYHTERLAAAGIYAQGEDPVLSAAMPNLSDYGYSYMLYDTEDGLCIEDTTLLLGADISVRFYFIPGENRTADSYDFYLEGKPEWILTLGYDETRQMNYAAIEHLSPEELSKPAALLVKEAGEAEDRDPLAMVELEAEDRDPLAMVEFTVLSYCSGILESDASSAEMKNLALAIYYYCMAAWEM